jgi:hypothetical protein
MTWPMVFCDGMMLGKNYPEVIGDVGWSNYL